jgi:hypothetical protein
VDQNDQLSPAALAAIEKARKLLATNGRTPEESAIYAQKALEILEAHGLDIAAAEAAAHSGTAKREDKTGGTALYKWQRSLWAAVAKLNMCVHIEIKGLGKGQKYTHRVIGRPVNVLATQIMAGYLADAVERIAREWAKERGSNIFASPVIAFREGAATEITYRLYRLREERVARDAATKAANPGTPGTALVLADVVQTEDDANQEYLYGLEPGSMAKSRAQNAAYYAAVDYKARLFREDPEAFIFEFGMDAFEALERQLKERADAHAAWLKKDAARQKRARETGPRYRTQTPEEKRRDSPAFSEGYRKAKDIGLDAQVDAQKRSALR